MNFNSKCNSVNSCNFKNQNNDDYYLCDNFQKYENIDICDKELIDSINEQNIKKFRKCVDWGANPFREITINNKNTCPFAYCVSVKFIIGIQYLIECNIKFMKNIKYYNYSPLTEALNNKNSVIVKMFIDAGAII